MAKQVKALCFHCDGRMSIGESFCGHCGRPSIWATHDERVAWEVAQWRAVSGSKRQDVHTPAFAPSRSHREHSRSEEAPPAREPAAVLVREEIVSVRDYPPTRWKPEEAEPVAAPPPPTKSETAIAASSAPPASRAEATPQAAAVDSAAPVPKLAPEPEAPEPERSALVAVPPSVPPTTDELLEELVLLVGQMNERIETIESLLNRPSLWNRIVSFLRGLYRAG